MEVILVFSHVQSCGAPRISFINSVKGFIDLRFEGLFSVHFASINKFSANRRNNQKSGFVISF